MPTKPIAAFVLALACLAGAPASAGTCRMTVQGTPVLDDVDCSLAAGRRGDAVVTLAEGGTITVRRSVLVATLPGRPRPDGSRSGRLFARSFGRVVASPGSPGEEQTCYFNQKATLCVDP